MDGGEAKAQAAHIEAVQAPVQRGDQAAAGAGIAMDASGDRRSLLQADTRRRIINRIQPNSISDMQLRQPQQQLNFQTQSQPAQFKQQKKQLFQSQRPIPEAPAPSTSFNSTTQTGSVHGGDWQEETYQKIRSMKEMYFVELNEVYKQIVAKLQKHDSLSDQQHKNIEWIERLKFFKVMFEKLLKLLRLNKNEIQLAHREKIGSWEKQIVNLLSGHRARKPVCSFQSQQPHSQIPQIQPHQNQMNAQMQSVNVQDSPNSCLDPAEGNECMGSDHDEATTEAQVQVPDQGAETAAATRAAMDAGDWRSQLQDVARQGIVDRIMETLRKHLDISDEKELKKIAVRFEEKIYNAAASQLEYLRKISLKMLTMETKSQTTISNKNPTDSVPSPAPRSVPSSSLKGRVIPSPSLPSPPQKKRLANDKQRLPFRARSPKRFLMAERFDVGKEVTTQSAYGYDSIFEDEAVGYRSPSTSLLERDKACLAGIPSDGLCKNLLDHLTKGWQLLPWCPRGLPWWMSRRSRSKHFKKSLIVTKMITKR